MIKYLIIPFCFIVFSILIRKYNNHLKNKYGNNYACKDLLNHKIISIYKLNGCIWNIIHIFIYFLLCILFNAKKIYYKHILIFFIGLLWYFLAPYSNYNNNPNKCQNTVYSDTNIPRQDDIIFNSLGQLVYIFLLT